MVVDLLSRTKERVKDLVGSFSLHKNRENDGAGYCNKKKVEVALGIK
jgi:hypothetical protein